MDPVDLLIGRNDAVALPLAGGTGPGGVVVIGSLHRAQHDPSGVAPFELGVRHRTGVVAVASGLDESDGPEEVHRRIGVVVLQGGEKLSFTHDHHTAMAAPAMA